MDLVVDASVVVKWFVEEDGSDQALLLRDDFVADDVTLHAPAHLLFEVLNAIRYNPAVNEERALQAQVALDGYGLELHPLRGDLARRSLHLAYTNDLTVYDAAYLALAQDVDAPLVTADETLLQAAGKSGTALNAYESKGSPPSLPRRMK